MRLREKIKLKNRKLLFLLVLLVITVGFAVLTQNLNINGYSKLYNSTWDIHFENIRVTSGSVSIGTGDSAAKVDEEDDTKVNFTVTLDKPGDFYEFLVDVKNDGSIDGKIESISTSVKIGDDEAFEITKNPSNLPKYILYDVTYEDDSEIEDNHKLKSNEKETYKVRVEYNKDINPTDLPESDKTLTFDLVPVVKQSDGEEESNSSTLPSVSEGIYWALQDNDGDGKNEKLLISDSQVTGVKSGNFSGDTVFADITEVPWISASSSSIASPVANDGSYVSNIIVEGEVVPVSTAYWFTGVGSKQTSDFTANLTNLNTSRVTDMAYMFYNTGSNASTFVMTGLGGWNTSSVENMHSLFCFAGNKASTWDIGNIGSWNVSKVTNMEWMFAAAAENATSSIVLNLNGWDTSKVESMQDMFSEFAVESHSVTLNVEGFKTSSVKNMRDMFECSMKNVDTISYDLTGWDTSNVEDMAGMFIEAGYFCSTFNLNLSNWDVTNVTDMSYMFENSGYASINYTVNISGWNTSNVEDMSYMFDAAGDSYRNESWIVTIPQTNGGGINNDSKNLYGKTTSIYGRVDDIYKSFTLAS